MGKGALTKNLFFKVCQPNLGSDCICIIYLLRHLEQDKKHRYYIVSALPDTKVDLKDSLKTLHGLKLTGQTLPEKTTPDQNTAYIKKGFMLVFTVFFYQDVIVEDLVPD
ncbi:hypothetical protein Leryth_023065 [Lithospermum erythrorhizon]|nr:hypothetical protein Leryth_023065 [Lithospermum erythrorhizon]